MTWDVTKPAGTRNRSLGDDDIREFKTDLQTALQAYGNFPVSTTSPEYHYQGQRGDTASRPTNGEGGLYFDTDTEELLRDNGSSWERVAINIPDGTKMYFYQAAAPTGWTIDSSADDRLLCINNSNGGTTNGSFSTITSSTEGDHTHTYALASTISSNPSIFFYSGLSLQIRTTANATSGSVRNSISGLRSGTSSGFAYTEEVGDHTHTLTHSLTTHAVSYVIMATKDAL